MARGGTCLPHIALRTARGPDPCYGSKIHRVTRAEDSHSTARPSRERQGARFASATWLAVAVGLAFVILQFLPYRDDDPIMFGVVLLFLGIGLLIYYATARRMLGAATNPSVKRP